jgi:hydrogenase expression/formation protein HypE
VAILSVREGLEFETELASDVAPLGGLVEGAPVRLPGARHARSDTRRGGERAP